MAHIDCVQLPTHDSTAKYTNFKKKIVLFIKEEKNHES